MAGQFFERLRNYYAEVAKVLRGEAQAASIFPNPTDIGIAREQVFAEFLLQHAPSKCNVFYGGFLFGEDGSESGQLDVIVTTDTTPRFNLHNRDGLGKSFSPVEGTLGVASIKSYLGKNEIQDALEGIANIPATSSLEGRIPLLLKIRNYDDWPYKIVYATDGVSATTLLGHIADFYAKNPGIPLCRRPNIISISGKYVIFRIVKGMTMWDGDKQSPQHPELGTFHVITRDSDLQGILWILNSLQQNATASTHIFYSYAEIMNQVNGLPRLGGPQQQVNADDPSATPPIKG